MRQRAMTPVELEFWMEVYVAAVGGMVLAYDEEGKVLTPSQRADVAVAELRERWMCKPETKSARGEA